MRRSLVGIDVWVKAGSAIRDAQEQAVSRISSSICSSAATRKRKPGDMDREMESLGATLDAHTTVRLRPLQHDG